MRIMDSIGIPQPSAKRKPRTLLEWIWILSESWFNRKRSLEAMMCGTDNYNSVLNYIRKRPWDYICSKPGCFESPNRSVSI